MQYHHTARERSSTRKLLRDRIRRLEAVALHHSRVAQMAIDMRSLMQYVGYERAQVMEHLDYLSDRIDRSHVEAFGISMFEGMDLDNPQ